MGWDNDDARWGLETERGDGPDWMDGGSPIAVAGDRAAMDDAAPRGDREGPPAAGRGEGGRRR